MKISIAQTRPSKGEVECNIYSHTQLINTAIFAKCDANFFPELSLTGYEPSMAKALTMDINDPRLEVFQDLSTKCKIVIGIGIPTKSKEGIKISMVLFQPGKPRNVYSKQQLHADELPYFICGEEQLIISINEIKIGFGICYETLLMEHSNNVKQLGAEIYIASVAKSQNGLDKAIQFYPEVSRIHSMPILMSNCIGPCDDFLSVGHSLIWNKMGEMICQLEGDEEGLLIYDVNTEDAMRYKHEN